jgi:hypothetical protein
MKPLTLTLEHSVMDWVARYPELNRLFTSIGMNSQENRSLVFESLYASCLVQQLNPTHVLEDIAHYLEERPSHS